MLALLTQPFIDYGFMRRALVAGLALALGATPVGVMLLLRRMSLMGDALSHSVLPGAAIGFLISGLSITALGLGGLIAGLIVALLATYASRSSRLTEDASFAGFYLTSLAAGVMIVSLRGSSVDLLHVLFGTILAIDSTALYYVGTITSLTLVLLAWIYRPLIMECFDREFLETVDGRGTIYHAIFMFLVVINLVAGFQALGTLMSVGMMMLPALVARLWVNGLIKMMALAIFIGMLSAYVGLLTSFYWALPSGPAIVLTASVLYIFSLLIAPGGLRRHHVLKGQ